MNQELKIKCYRNAYATLGKEKLIKNLARPEKQEDLELECDIEDIHISYCLRLKTDLLTIKSSRHYPDAEDEYLEKIARDTTRGTNVRATFYDEKVIFNLARPFVGLTDAEAETVVNDTLNEFITFILERALNYKDVAPLTFVDGDADPEPAKDEPEEEPTPEPVQEPVEEKPTQLTIEPEEVISDDEPEIEPLPTSEEIAAASADDDYLVDDFLSEFTGEDEFMLDEEDEDSDVDTEAEKADNDIPFESKVKYERAPEVVVQMKEMYDELNEVFELRKKQLDYRENTLNQREATLKARIKDFESEKVSITSMKDQMDLEKSKIQLKWDKYHEKNKIQEDVSLRIHERESELDRREIDISKKEQSIQDKIRAFDSKNSTFKKEQEEFSKAKAATDELSKHLTDKEIELNKREKEVNSKLDDLSVREQRVEIREKQFELKDQALRESKKSIDEREAFVKTLEGPMIQEDHSPELQEKIDKLSQTVAALKKDKERQRKAYISLQKAYDKARAQATAPNSSNELKRLKSSAEKQAEEFKQKEADYTKRISELEEAVKASDKKKAAAEAELNRTSAELTELKNSTQPDITILKVEEKLHAAGYNLEAAGSDNNAMIVGEIDGCTVCVNEEVKMIYAEKPVKKAAKHSSTLEAWNQEDIRVSYFTNGNRVVCKKLYSEDTLVDDIRKIIERIGALK